MHDDDVVLDPKLEPYMDALNRLKEEFGDEAFDEVFTIATEEDSIRVDALGVANDDMIMLFVGDPEDVLDDEYFELVNDVIEVDGMEEGQFLLKVLYVSVDPVMRVW